MRISKSFGLVSSLVLLPLVALTACGDSSPAPGVQGAGESPSAAAEREAQDGRAQAQRDLVYGEETPAHEQARLWPQSTNRAPQVEFRPMVGTTWSELAALPNVTTAYGFALAVSDVDSKAHLGFMFYDPTYRAQLNAQGVLWAGEDSYYGDNVVVMYGFSGTGASTTWSPYQGRFTPQYYKFSELRYDSGNSYYTTNYDQYGGLISVIRNGGKGVYALTPTTVTARAHSVAFNAHVLYALASQQSVGLTLSTTPASSFGDLNNNWVDKATIETSAAGAALPELIDAGGTLVGAYIQGGSAKVRATSTPGSVTTASAFTSIGTFTGATKVDVAYAGGFLYAATTSSTGVLTVRKTALSPVSWTTVTTGVSGAVTDFDLAGQGSVIALAVRQSTSVKVFDTLTASTPSFNQVVAGSIALQPAAEGLVLSTCDLTASPTKVRTFLK